MESDDPEGVTGSHQSRMGWYRYAPTEAASEELGHRSRYGRTPRIPRLADDSPRFRATAFIHENTGFHSVWLQPFNADLPRLERAIHDWRIEWLMRITEQRLNEE